MHSTAFTLAQLSQNPQNLLGNLLSIKRHFFQQTLSKLLFIQKILSQITLEMRVGTHVDHVINCPLLLYDFN
jgi:hypothetical protein